MIDYQAIVSSLALASLIACSHTAHADIAFSSGQKTVPLSSMASAYEQPPLSSDIKNDMKDRVYTNLAPEHTAMVQAAEVMASQAAKRVLQQARVMSLDKRVIIGGGCWNYLNAVFLQAGSGRDTLFKGTLRGGPYASSEQLQGGDWLYFINHGYNDGEHSGLFIGWVDKAAHQALILSYAGENRQEPARYSVYDVSHVYQIMRPTL